MKLNFMAMENCNFTDINEFGAKCQAVFKINEYHRLMELLFDKYLEEWGDCKGRAWYGTCHIKILKCNHTDTIDEDKGHTLSKIPNAKDRRPSACQIPVNAELNMVVLKIKETS